MIWYFLTSSRPYNEELYKDNESLLPLCIHNMWLPRIPSATKCYVPNFRCLPFFSQVQDPTTKNFTRIINLCCHFYTWLPRVPSATKRLCSEFSSSSIRSCHNHHFDYCPTIMCYLCLSMPLAIRPFLIKDEYGIFDMYNDSGCSAVLTEARQALMRLQKCCFRGIEKVPHPAISRR